MEEKVKAELKRIFGFSQFRGTQELIVDNLLKNRNTFVIMPTGAGKSLCYQLPAVVQEGTAIVISPLIALMLATVPVILGATILWLVGQRLRTDAHTQQTNTGQTPDARLHAFPHCGY